MRRLFVLVLLTLVAVGGFTAAVRAAFPEPTGRVTDAAGILDAPTRERAAQRIADAERDSGGAEIAVVTVPSLDGASIENYAASLFASWGIGKEGVDNGVLLLVAPNDRQVRIEVGYGLEPILPDGLAGDIIRHQATPAFRNGDYATGVIDALDRIASIVVARHVVTDDERKALEAAAVEGPPAIVMTLFFGLFLSVGTFMLAVGLRARAAFPVLFGSVFGGIPGLMAIFPFFNVHWAVLAPVLGVIFVFAFIKAGNERWRAIARDQKGSGGGVRTTGWVSGASSSGSRGYGSSSGGGSRSSFGGGRSGGGGASGRW